MKAMTDDGLRKDVGWDMITTVGVGFGAGVAVTTRVGLGVTATRGDVV